VRVNRSLRALGIGAGVAVAAGLFATFGLTTVPDVTGKETRAAFEALADAGLSGPDITGIGTVVVRTSPEAGSRVLRFSSVNVVMDDPAGE